MNSENKKDISVKDNNVNNSNNKVAAKNNNKLIDFFVKFPLDYYFATFVASFCLANTMNLFTLQETYINLNSVLTISIPFFITYIVMFFVAILFIAYMLNRINFIPIVLAISATFFASSLAFYNPDNIYFNIGLAFILFMVFAWISKKDKMNLSKLKLGKNTEWIIAIALALIFILVVSIASISRYSAYMAHNYDLGIFAQMFKNMSTTGLPDTTVERNVLMSHFGVHFSPFYYLLLPFYMIAPCTETLLVIQAVAIGVGVFPLVLICKKLELSRLLTVAFSFIYVLFPTLSNGALFDFHENKFLTVLILWALYFMVSKKTIPFFIFSVLILTVKEDAAIYVIAIALFMMFYRKEYKKGGILLGISIAYFVFAGAMVAYFNILDDGVMIARLNNYIADDGSFLSVIITCFTNIGYFITQVFTLEKLPFILWMFLPLAFAPFMNKKKSVLLLLIPMLVINLMSNWQYQYDVAYQYTFGVAALIIFMAILGIQKLKTDKRIMVATLSIAMCFVCTFSLFVPRAINYISYDNQYKDTNNAYDELISTIPKDETITANSLFIPHMYDFKELYQYPTHYGESAKTEYFLISSVDYDSNKDNLATFMGDDYELINSAGNMQLYKLK